MLLVYNGKQWQKLLRDERIPGLSCSKLTTSLVKDPLKFTLRDTQIC